MNRTRETETERAYQIEVRQGEEREMMGMGEGEDRVRLFYLESGEEGLRRVVWPQGMAVWASDRKCWGREFKWYIPRESTHMHAANVYLIPRIHFKFLLVLE